MGVNWRRAPELEAVAEWLIPQSHPHLGEQEYGGCAVRIEYWFRDDRPKSGGRDLMGRAVKVSDIAALLAMGGEAPHGVDWTAADPFFLVWVPSHVWDACEEAERAGLVDHLLCYCCAGRDDGGAVRLRKALPDFTGFKENIGRWGFWWRGATEMFEAMRRAGQLRLDLDGAPPELAVKVERAPLTITGMGELEEGEDGRVVLPFVRTGGCGCQWDVRMNGDECPIHGAGAAVPVDVDGEERSAAGSLVTCAEGHDYDGEQHGACPRCEVAVAAEEERTRSEVRQRLMEAGGRTPPPDDGGAPFPAAVAAAIDGDGGVVQTLPNGARKPGVRKAQARVPDPAGFREHVDAKRSARRSGKTAGA